VTEVDVILERLADLLEYADNLIYTPPLETADVQPCAIPD
jgi:hypothetical protein